MKGPISLKGKKDKMMMMSENFSREAKTSVSGKAECLLAV